MAVDSAVTAPARAAVWNDPRYRAIAYQVLALAVVVGLGWYLTSNTMANLDKRGIASGFGFLQSTAGFSIVQALIPYSEASTYGTAFVVSLINTIILAIVGVFLATILGFVIGVMRLSRNYLISTFASVYIETFRNIPLLLQIFFWYHAVLKPLPGPRALYDRGDVVAFSINNRGFYLPEPVALPGFWLVVAAFIVGILGTIYLKSWAARKQAATGEQTPVFAIGLGLIVGLPIVVFFVAGLPMTFAYAEMKGFQLSGGIRIIPEFTAMLLALSIYTASFIAEIVRAGIQSVSHGQTEAAHALGLRPRQTLRLVIIPQAMRVIIPPLTSQFLNLTKNSSLATAIAYPELVAVFAGTVLNQTGQAVEIIAITMAVYLTLSLLTSAFMNWYNARIALVER